MPAPNQQHSPTRRFQGPDGALTIAKLGTAAASFAAIFSLPYGYYVLLRWIVTAVGAYLSVSSWARGREGWAWVFGVTALMFNPILPVHLGRETWRLVDGLVGSLLVASALARRPKGSTLREGE